MFRLENLTSTLARHRVASVYTWLHKFTCTFHEVASFQLKISTPVLGLACRSIRFSMCLDTARGAERILQVLKWDLPQQRLPTEPAPPVDKDKSTQKHTELQSLNYTVTKFNERIALGGGSYLMLQRLTPVAATCSANLFSAARALYNQQANSEHF